MRALPPFHFERFTYRSLHAADIPEVSGLVARVFDQFVAPDYAPEGVREFHRYIQPSAFEMRAQKDHFSLVALAQDRIVGMIEMRGYDHISLLFVDSAYQRRGIARELLRLALEVCQANAPGLAVITVNASPYALPVYEKLGFFQAGERQVKNGIGFIPMALKRSSSAS